MSDDQARLEFEIEARDRGMFSAAENRKQMLAKARAIALELGAPTLFDRAPTVTADDVRAAMERRGLAFRPGNWMGSIFKDGNWQVVGQRKASHKKGHARRILVWQRCIP